MPEVLPRLDAALNPLAHPSPRVALFWDGTYWHAATVDAAGHLQIDVLSTVMDAAAATAANQATMITALQLIDNLVVALGGPGNARLQVRGEDQLFSYDSPLAVTRNAVVSGANGVVDSDSPPDGYVWIAHHVAIRNRNSAITGLVGSDLRGGVTSRINTTTIDLAANTWFAFPCTVHLEHDDAVRVWFLGAIATDTCDVQLTGSVMTKEV